MVQIGISDISKNVALFDQLEEIAEIRNKKTRQVKGIFIPAVYLDMFKDVLNEIEYHAFAKRNAGLATVSEKNDDTLADGLDDAY
jgi:hypothetical protein